jgi:hypothetical protein
MFSVSWPAGGHKLAQQAIKIGGQFLAATSTGLVLSESLTDRACFSIQPVIDMADVMAAFADRHRGQHKKRTYHFDNSGLGWVHNAEIHDCRPHNSPGMNQIVITQISDSGGAIQAQIPVWFMMDGDRVGIAGDYEIRNGTEYTYRTFTREGKFVESNHMLALAPRRLTPDMVGVSTASTFNTFWGKDATHDLGPGSAHSIIDFIGERDMGNGTRRWVIGLSSDQRYPDENGHKEGFPYETIFYDLGPREGVYDPEFSFIGYRHTYADGNGVPDGRVAEEFYADVADGMYHRDVTSFLRF